MLSNPANSDIGKIIAEMESKYEQELLDFDRYWYLGHRFIYHPFSGYVNAPFKSDTLNINSHGFRGAEYKYKNVTNRTRVGVFGPSGVVGIPIANDGTNLTACLQRAFDAASVSVEVMNFAVISARIGHEANILAKALIDYDIDIVVHVSGFNDTTAYVLGSLWEYSDTAAIQDSGFVRNRNLGKPLFFAGEFLRSLKRANKLREARRCFRERIRGAEKFFRAQRHKTIDQPVFVPVPEIGTRVYLSYLNLIKSACEYAGKPYYYSFQPSLFTTGKTLSTYEAVAAQEQNMVFGSNRELQEKRIFDYRALHEDLRQKTRDLISGSGHSYIDLEAVFDAEGQEEDVFYDESHYFPYGNGLLAQKIANSLGM